jgi:hypothetical protein
MNQPDSPEFTEILNRVPRWHMLTPGEKLNRDTDEYIEHYAGEKDFHSCKNMDSDSACDYADDVALFRRPIPETIRRSMAWWSLAEQVLGEKRLYRYYGEFVCDTASPFESTTGWDDHSGITRMECKRLGGEQEILNNLKRGPESYMRWILK